MPGPSHRIVFAGTPDFAVPALDALLAAGHEVAAVYTQPDRRAGRGRRLSAPPVKRRALAAGIPVYQPESLRTAAAQQQLQALKPDVMVVVAYGLLLPQAVLDIPARGCLNIHASLLPRWRGAAPVQRALQAGDERTGISIMQMEAGLDTGPVLLVRETAIRPEDTGGSLHDRLAALGGEAIVAALADPEALTPRPQDESGVTYARKLTKAEARLDWQRPAAELARDVRAFNPWPVCFTRLGNETLRVWEARPQAGDGRFAPGTVVAVSADGLRVAAGGYSELVLTRVQAPGGRPLAVRDFLNAHPVEPGMRLT